MTKVTGPGVILPYAVLLVDMQDSVVRPPDSRVADLIEASGVVAACQRAVAGARSIGLNLIYIRTARRPGGLGGPSTPVDIPLRSKTGGRTGGHSGARTAQQASQIVAPLRPTPQELVVVKQGRSAFVGTDLDILLRSLGAQGVAIGGIATNWGVESTARSAYDLGLGVVILSDCCAGFDLDDHHFAMSRILPTMARVMTWAEFAGLATDRRNPL